MKVNESRGVHVNEYIERWNNENDAIWLQVLESYTDVFFSRNL